MAVYKKNVSLQVEPALLQKARDWAKRERRSLSAFIIVALETRVAFLEDQNLRESEERLANPMKGKPYA